MVAHGQTGPENGENISSGKSLIQLNKSGKPSCSNELPLKEPVCSNGVLYTMMRVGGFSARLSSTTSRMRMRSGGDQAPQQDAASSGGEDLQASDEEQGARGRTTGAVAAAGTASTRGPGAVQELGAPSASSSIVLQKVPRFALKTQELRLAQDSSVFELVRWDSGGEWRVGSFVPYLEEATQALFFVPFEKGVVVVAGAEAPGDEEEDPNFIEAFRGDTNRGLPEDSASDGKEVVTNTKEGLLAKHGIILEDGLARCRPGIYLLKGHQQTLKIRLDALADGARDTDDDLFERVHDQSATVIFVGIRGASVRLPGTSTVSALVHDSATDRSPA